MAVSQPALLGATQTRKKQKNPQFMFPDVGGQMNFQGGLAQQPSNNVAQQNLFSQNDPFASAVPGLVPRGVSSVVDAAAAGADGTIIGQPVGDPVQFQPSVEGQQPPARQDRDFTLSGDRAALTKPVTPLDILENPKGAAAQLLGSTLVNNPFISAKGRQALREGRVPQLNDIQPAFYRFTNPRDIAALQGLIAGSSKTAPTLESQEFFTNVFRAPSL